MELYHCSSNFRSFGIFFPFNSEIHTALLAIKKYCEEPKIHCQHLKSHLKKNLKMQILNSLFFSVLKWKRSALVSALKTSSGFTVASASASSCFAEVLDNILYLLHKLFFVNHVHRRHLFTNDLTFQGVKQLDFLWQSPKHFSKFSNNTMSNYCAWI